MNRGRGIHIFNDLNQLHKLIKEYCQGKEEENFKKKYNKEKEEQNEEGLVEEVQADIDEKVEGVDAATPSPNKK